MKPRTRRTGYDPLKAVQYLQEVTGLGRDTVRAAIRSGELPGLHVGNRYTLPEETFRLFCEGRWVPKPRPVLMQPATAITPPRMLNRKVS